MALQQIGTGQGVGPLPLQFGGGIPPEDEHRLLGTGLEGTSSSTCRERGIVGEQSQQSRQCNPTQLQSLESLVWSV